MTIGFPLTMSEILSTFFITSSSRAVLKSLSSKYSSRWLAPKLYKVKITESRNFVLKMRRKNNFRFNPTYFALKALTLSNSWCRFSITIITCWKFDQKTFKKLSKWFNTLVLKFSDEVQKIKIYLHQNLHTFDILCQILETKW